MKERWKLVQDSGTQVVDGTYYAILERHVWRFYFRVIKKHFTPCQKCQEVIDEKWNIGIFLSGEWYNNFVKTASNLLCGKCNKEIHEINKYAEVIIGNKDYEPPVELQRKWDLSDERKPESIDLTQSRFNELVNHFGTIINMDSSKQSRIFIEYSKL